MNKDERRITWWTLLITMGIFMVILGFLVARFCFTDLRGFLILHKEIAGFSEVLDEIQEVQTERFSLVFSSVPYSHFNEEPKQILLAKRQEE